MTIISGQTSHPNFSYITKDIIEGKTKPSDKKPSTKPEQKVLPKDTTNIQSND